MNKPAMMDWALRLLRLLNERKVLTSRIVADEFGVNIRTAQRYLRHLAVLPCVSEGKGEMKNTYSLTTAHVMPDKILSVTETAMVCAMIDYATHIFGPEHSTFLASLKDRIFRRPDVYQVLSEDAIDMRKVASVRQMLELHIKQREVVTFSYRKKGKRYTVEPYKILYNDGFWYLVGLHEKIVKKFVLDFIEGARGVGRYYREVPANVDKMLNEAKTIWFNDKEPDRVTVEFDKEVAHFFDRKSIFPRQEIVEKKGNGNVVLSFDVHNEMDLREHVARWMPYFEVIEPAGYREYIRGVAAEVAKRNKNVANRLV
jgi:predicted DNA-binding transcriptional regulator YafY